MWELFICLGLTGFGCGAVLVSPYPTEESCYRALAAMKADDKAKSAAYCRPKVKA